MYKQVKVESISSHILWNYREYSTTRRYYKAFFRMLLVALILAFVFTTKLPSWQSFKEWLRFIASLKQKKLKLPSRQSCKKWLEFITTVIVKTSFFILLTTYDISIWECLEGPSEIIYSNETTAIELNYMKSAIAYQHGGSIASLVLLVMGMIMSIEVTLCNARLLVSIKQIQNTLMKKKRNTKVSR